MTTDDYLGLITSEHRDKPNFIATVSLWISGMVQIQALYATFNTIFDIDHAVGDQLDILGQWAGVSRNVNIPITGVFFTWDGTDLLGWDSGSWPPANSQTSITVLPDENYRTLIKAKIAANHWDGTTEGAYAIWEIIFPTITLLIVDNQDMTMSIAIVGGVVDALTLALLTGGYLPLKPEGVHINSYVVPVDDSPLFGWDLETDFIQGWDEGSWGVEILPT